VATRQSKASKSSTASSAAELTCPECGRTFTRPAALGAHRRLVHGIVGASSRRRSRTSGRRGARASSSATAGGAPSTGSGAQRRRSTTRSRAARSTAASSNSGTDRDALLRTLFPAGIPAREDVIRSINSWLDEADRLARIH
jgi:hypothetical protein